MRTLSRAKVQRRRAFPVLALFLVSCAGVLLLAEGLLRLLRPPAASVIRYPCIYVPDDRVGFRYRPGAVGRVAGHFEIDNPVEMNSLGFYDDEPLPTGESGLRVVAVGDSFTAALNLPRDQVWTAVLERELRARVEPTADVVNLGLDGTGTDVHVELLRAHLPDLDPDVVIVAFFGNDLQDIIHGRFTRECYRDYVLSYQTRAQRDLLRARVDAHLERHFSQRLFDHSYAARLFFHWREGGWNLFRLEFVQPRLAELGIDDRVRRERLPRVARAFDALERLAAECDCRVLLAPVPPRRRLDGSAMLLQPLLRGRELEMVDVSGLLGRELAARRQAATSLFFVNDDHLNAEGNRLFAEALAGSVAWPTRGRAAQTRDR